MTDNLSFLSSLFQINPEIAADYLYEVHPNRWAGLSEPAFCEAYETLLRRLAFREGMAALLWLHLIGHFLIHADRLPRWAGAFLQTRAPGETAFAVSIQKMQMGRWSAVAIWLVIDGRAHRRFFLIGRGPWPETGALIPEWAVSLFDAPARQAMADAVSASLEIGGSALDNGESFLIFPILPPDTRVHVTGRSHGLAVALACAALRGKAPLADTIAASGDVEKGGRLRKVRHLMEKSALASRFGYHGFICPAEGHVAAGEYPMEMLPAATLEDAVMLNALFEPGKGERLQLFKAMLGSPVRFVDNCLNVPGRWLAWMRDQKKDLALRNAASTDPELFKELLHQFQKSLETDHPACRFFAALFNPDDLRRLPVTHQVEGFKWAVLALATANHAGQLSPAGQWTAFAEEQKPDIQKFHSGEVVNFLNHLFIDIYHNRFSFPAALPFVITDILHRLESIHLAQCSGLGCVTHMELGALYGTIGQHYAFQGPNHLQTALGFFEKARNALGDPSPGLSSDWRRQYAYEAYAYLDAGKWEPAAIALKRYLMISGWEELTGIVSHLEKYAHALLARFVADTGDPAVTRCYVADALNRCPHEGQAGHPWQLWSYNMGRVLVALGEPDRAELFFRESLCRCMAPDVGPTIQVMALLPLSGLESLNRLSRRDLENRERDVRKAMDPLDAGHFAALKVMDFRRMIQSVSRSPERWFPFAYR